MKLIFLVLLLSVRLFAEGGSIGYSGGGIPFITPTNNQCLVGNGTSWNPGSCSTGTGTVTSVALSLPSSILTVSGSPVTGSGTLTAVLANSLNAANGLVQLNGSGYLPALNASLLTNFPTLNQNTTGTAANVTASSNSSLTTLSALSLPGSQITGNISGNAANTSATTNSTITTLSALSLPGSQVSSHVTADMVYVAPSTSGNILTSNGSAWTSAAPVGVWVVGGTTTTTDASAHTAATVGLSASSSYTCKAIIAGFRTDAADYAHFEVNGSIHSNSGSTCTFEDSTILYQKVSDVNFTVAWACSGTNVVLQVTGNTGKTIDWTPKYICESAS